MNLKEQKTKKMPLSHLEYPGIVPLNILTLSSFPASSGTGYHDYGTYGEMEGEGTRTDFEDKVIEIVHMLSAPYMGLSGMEQFKEKTNSFIRGGWRGYDDVIKAFNMSLNDWLLNYPSSSKRSSLDYSLPRRGSGMYGGVLNPLFENEDFKKFFGRNQLAIDFNVDPDFREEMIDLMTKIYTRLHKIHRSWNLARRHRLNIRRIMDRFIQTANLNILRQLLHEVSKP